MAWNLKISDNSDKIFYVSIYKYKYGYIYIYIYIYIIMNSQEQI